VRTLEGPGIGLCALLIAACASSPVTLVALPAAPRVAQTQGSAYGAGTTILLRQVFLPRYLDAYPVLLGHQGNTLIVANKIEWAEPFPDAVSRVLRDALSQRLGPSHVLIPGDGRIPGADLTVEFLALDPREGEVRLDAKWTFACTAPVGASHSGQTSIQVPLEAATASSVAAATAVALGRLADALAAHAQCA